MKIFFSLSIVFLFVFGNLSSQVFSSALPIKELNVLLRNEASGGFFVHSRGIGINYRRGFHVTGQRKRVFELEVLTMRSPKEIKVARSENSKGYYYGKLNSLYITRPGVGFQNVLFRRGDRKSIEIRYSTFIGPSMCLAKPVFLEILHHNPANPDQKFVSTEKYDPEIHNQNNISGRAPFFTGFIQSKLYVGAYGKFSISCEYAESRFEIKSFELGAVIDVYPAKIPIMATSKNTNLLLTLYTSFIFGKKWF